jgi:hypothetical protein
MNCQRSQRRTVLQPSRSVLTTEPRSHISRLSRRSRIHLFVRSAALLLCSALALNAQTDAPRVDRRIPRRLVFGLAGAAVGGLAGALYSRSASSGMCSSSACRVPFGASIGGITGFAIGRELDRLHALRFRGGAPLRIPNASAPIGFEPTAIGAGNGIVGVGGTDGVAVFSSTGAFARDTLRAFGVRGITAVAYAPDERLAVGARSGLYVFPPQRGAGTVVRDGAISGVVPARRNSRELIVASGDRVELVAEQSDSVRAWPGISLGTPIVALQPDDRFSGERAIVWALADSLLVAVEHDSTGLHEVTRLSLGVSGRRLAIAGTRAAIAAGDHGVLVLDIADVAVPRVIARWTGPQFAYDVAVAGSRLYVAAGVEGVYLVDIGRDRPPTIGLARGLGFATALATQGGFIYVIDRSSNTIRRLSAGY